MDKSPRFITKLMGSLTLRIVVVCLFLLVIPLIFYSLTMSVRDFRYQTIRLMLVLVGVGKIHECQVQRILQNNIQNLTTIKTVTDFDTLTEEGIGSIELSEIFANVAKEENLGSLFYFSINEDGTYTTLATNVFERIGKNTPIPEEGGWTKLRAIPAIGYSIFLASDPWNGEKKIYIAMGIYAKNNPEKLIGILGSSILALPLIEELQQKHQIFYFTLALLDDDDTIFVSSNPNLTLENIHILSSENLTPESIKEFAEEEQKQHYLHLLTSDKDHIGLKIGIPKTNFSLLVEVPDKLIEQIKNEESFFRLLLLIGSIFVIGGAMTFFITKRFSKPLKSLSEVMEKVGEGYLDARFTRDPLGFEINLLGKRFNETIDNLKIYIERERKERVAKEKLEQEFKIGLEIQKTILPTTMPEFPGVDVAAGFLPAKEVGGDFYDLYIKTEPGPHELSFAIADTSGKGISACLYSLGFRSMLRSFDSSLSDVKEIIDHTNDLFCLDSKDTGMFVTLFWGKYAPQTHLLSFSNNGHMPAILKRKDQPIIELSTKGMALGIQKLKEVFSETATIEKGDILILYTDGVLDTQNSKKEFFGKERFLKMIQENHFTTAQEWVDFIFDKIETFSESAMQYDDLTLLVIHFTS